MVSARADAAFDHSRVLWSFFDVRGDAVTSTRRPGSLAAGEVSSWSRRALAPPSTTRAHSGRSTTCAVMQSHPLAGLARCSRRGVSLVSAHACVAVDLSRALWSFYDVRGDAFASTRRSCSFAAGDVSSWSRRTLAPPLTTRAYSGRSTTCAVMQSHPLAGLVCSQPVMGLLGLGACWRRR